MTPPTCTRAENARTAAVTTSFIGCISHRTPHAPVDKSESTPLNAEHTTATHRYHRHYAPAAITPSMATS